MLLRNNVNIPQITALHSSAALNHRSGKSGYLLHLQYCDAIIRLSPNFTFMQITRPKQPLTLTQHDKWRPFELCDHTEKSVAR